MFKHNMEFIPEYWRKLPHIQPKDGVFFVTFRLTGTIPKSIIIEYQNKKESTKTKKEKLENSEEYFKEIEDILDSATIGPTWLKNKAIAKVIIESFSFMDHKYFHLICYCIMSNHVHFIAYNLKKPLYAIMHSIKSFTAHECNKILNRKGRFWQREYYDNLIRDRNDLAEKIKYVLNNPVKLGLVSNWKDWKFSYCNPRFIEF